MPTTESSDAEKNAALNNSSTNIKKTPQVESKFAVKPGVIPWEEDIKKQNPEDNDHFIQQKNKFYNNYSQAPSFRFFRHHGLLNIRMSWAQIIGHALGQSIYKNAYGRFNPGGRTRNILHNMDILKYDEDMKTWLITDKGYQLIEEENQSGKRLWADTLENRESGRLKINSQKFNTELSQDLQSRQNKKNELQQLKTRHQQQELENMRQQQDAEDKKLNPEYETREEYYAKNPFCV